MKIRIPKHRRETLAIIANLSSEEVKNLFGALAEFSPNSFGPGLPKNVATALADSGISNITEIVDTILSLFPLIISANKPLSEVVDDIVAAVEDQSGLSAETSVNNVQQLRENLNKLLRVPSMCLGAKAASIFFDNERNYLSSRVLTDIRPVFEMEVTEIGGAIVVHTLKIEYAENNVDKEIFLALSASDVDSLIANLRRAQDKVAKLEAVIGNSSLTLLNPDFS